MRRTNQIMKWRTSHWLDFNRSEFLNLLIYTVMMWMTIYPNWTPFRMFLLYFIYFLSNFTMAHSKPTLKALNKTTDQWGQKWHSIVSPGKPCKRFESLTLATTAVMWWVGLCLCKALLKLRFTHKYITMQTVRALLWSSSEERSMSLWWANPFQLIYYLRLIMCC